MTSIYVRDDAERKCEKQNIQCPISFRLLFLLEPHVLVIVGKPEIQVVS